jgi:cytochrome d ubiquinol oxidase subunit I
MITTLVAGLLVFISGDMQSRVMTEQQPMKMAAAEALYDTTSGAPFSLLTVGTLDGTQSVFALEIPRLLSVLSTGSTSGTVEGINDLQAEYEQTYGPGDYTPNIPVAYWTFRLMIGFGGLAGIFAIYALWTTRGGRDPQSKWFARMALLMPWLPLLGMSWGWIFTEMARQPWIVFGLMQTSAGVSPGVSVFEVATSLIVLTVLYGVLAVVEMGLLVKAIKAGPPVDVPEYSDNVTGERPLTFAY